MKESTLRKKARRARFSPTERIGTNAVERIFLEEFGWIPRSQESSDMGIDSQVEVCVRGEPTGKLIAVQVKSGKSFFGKGRYSPAVVRGDKTHYDYWMNHCLPVILVVHNPDTDETVWQHVTPETVVLSKHGWKVEIDRDQILSPDYSEDIAEIAEGPQALQRLRKLQLDKEIIELVAEGDTVCLEFEDWVNKSLSRTPLTLKVCDVDGNERVVRDTFLFYTGYTIEEMLGMSFPWAEFEVDHDYYDIHMDEESVAFMYGNPAFLKGIYPYEVVASEAAHFRVTLNLNDLGKAFLTVDEYLSPDL